MAPFRTDRARAVFWLQALSLAVTAWMVWRGILVPQLRSHSALDLAIRALFVSGLAALWGGVVTVALLSTIGRIERAQVIGVTLRTSAAAVWFAPAIILLTNPSLPAFVAALILVMSATRLLYSQWRLVYRTQEMPPVLVGQPGLFAKGEISTGFLPKHFGPALATALTLEAGLLAWGLDISGLAAALLCLAVALLTAYAIASGATDGGRQPTLPRSVLGCLLTILLAAGLTVTGMKMSGSGDSFGLSDGNSSTATAKPMPKAPGGATKKLEPLVSPTAYSAPKNGDFPGVIIWPEERPVPLLVEPTPEGKDWAKRTPGRPFSIPFDGEYWVFRMGYVRPPPGSFTHRGEPTNSFYRSVDGYPLQMEAHQKLDRTLDLSCCSKVQIEIVNVDTHSSPMLELAVIETGHPAVKLGGAQVKSHPVAGHDPVKPVYEVLDFAALPVRFDEIKVSFQRPIHTADRSARISIQRFVLVPR